MIMSGEIIKLLNSDPSLIYGVFHTKHETRPYSNYVIDE